MPKFIESRLQKLLPEEELETRVFWRSIAVISWVSFLFASVATMLFFATFDPTEITRIATYPLELSPLAGYSIGFILFWLMGFLCAAYSCFLLALPLNKRRKSMPD